MEQQHKQSRFWAETAVLLLLLCEWALSLASVSIDGVLGNLLGLLSYPVPICLFLLLFSRRQEIHLPLRPTTAGLMRVLPLLPVFLAAVLFVSTVTGFLLSLCGIPISGGSATEGSLPFLLFRHALYPALAEETLMRLCVLSLLATRSGTHAVPQSALLFALLHASLYQFPYAFVGGIFLALAALWGDSFLFAVLFHFINNALSLLMQTIPRLVGEAAGMYINLALSLCVFLLAAWGILVLLRRFRTSQPPRVRGWLRALLASPLLLYVLLMLFYMLI